MAARKKKTTSKKKPAAKKKADSEKKAALKKLSGALSHSMISWIKGGDTSKTRVEMKIYPVVLRNLGFSTERTSFYELCDYSSLSINGKTKQ